MRTEHTRPPTARSRPMRAGAVLLLLFGLVTACSESGDSATGAAPAGVDQASGGDTSTGGEAAGEAAAAPVEAGAPAGAAADPAQAVSARVQPGDSVVRSGRLEVAVEDVAAAAAEAARLTVGAGGRVDADDRSSTPGREGDDMPASTDAGPDTRATLVLRLPGPTFDATLTRLAELGEEQGRSLAAQDVTEQLVDLDARLSTQRASVARVRALLDRAGTIGEVVQVEGELTKRTAELESLQARLAAVRDRVDLGTLSLDLRAQRAPDAVAGGAGFLDGLGAGWQALTAAARVGAVTAGALLPFAPLLLIGAVLAWRRRTVRPART